MLSYSQIAVPILHPLCCVVSCRHSHQTKPSCEAPEQPLLVAVFRIYHVPCILPYIQVTFNDGVSPARATL
jgi:hypothetical protein